MCSSDLLERLTCGKYRRVWTPLGERQLRVEDSFGHSAQVETLSRGAREQLYLAIRLAVIQRLSRAGLEMPLLLDDVFVNFDAPRTEAAIDLLQEVAEGGQQVLFFTCHQHCVDMIQQVIPTATHISLPPQAATASSPSRDVQPQPAQAIEQIGRAHV